MSISSCPVFGYRVLGNSKTSTPRLEFRLTKLFMSLCADNWTKRPDFFKKVSPQYPRPCSARVSEPRSSGDGGSPGGIAALRLVVRAVARNWAISAGQLTRGPLVEDVCDVADPRATGLAYSRFAAVTPGSGASFCAVLVCSREDQDFVRAAVGDGHLFAVRRNVDPSARRQR